MKSLKELLEPKVKEFTYKLKEGEEIHKKDKYGAFIFCNDDYKCTYHGKVKVSLKYVFNSGITKYFCPICETENWEEKYTNKDDDYNKEKVLNTLKQSGLGQRYFYVKKESMKNNEAYSNILKYLDNINNGIIDDLIIYGGSKSGKTLTCAIVINTLAKDTSLSMKYILFNDLIMELKNKNKDSINQLKETDLLLIDDVNFLDNASKSLLKSLIDYRYSNMLQTVVVVDETEILKYFKNRLESAFIIRL